MTSSHKEQSQKAKQIRRGITEPSASGSPAKKQKNWTVIYKFTLLKRLNPDYDQVNRRYFSKESGARMSIQSLLKQEYYYDIMLIHPDGTMENFPKVLTHCDILDATVL